MLALKLPLISLRRAIAFQLGRIPDVVLKTGTAWNVLLKMDDHTFRRHLRVSRAQFDSLTSQLKEQGLKEDHQAGGCPEVPLLKKVLMFLWYLANQNSFREMSDKFDISQGAAHNAILEVLSLVCKLAPAYITWPSDCQKRAVSAAFERVCTIGNIIGAIDGCHIKIQRPKICGDDYINRKSFYSVLLQGIVDEKGRFIDIFTGPPGRVHDARMLRTSTFYTNWEEKMGNFELLGDSAYIGQAFPFIITPKRDNGALTDADLQQNACLSRGRVIVENAFGRMKCRWRRMRDLQNTRIDVVVKMIVAACTLHNMCLGSAYGCDEHPHGCPRQEDDDNE